MLQFLQQLFQRRGRAAASWQPTLAPTSGQVRQHQAWVEERVYLNWLGPYFKAYHLRKGGAGGRRGLRVELLCEAGRQGGLFFYDASIGPGNFQHLFLLLGERLEALGYHRVCHDQRQRQCQQHREVMVKQFFKPNPTDCAHSGRCNQRYGLVSLDLVSVNNQPFFIRLATNPVQESHFTPPQPFEALLAEVFDEPAPDAATRQRARAYARG